MQQPVMQQPMIQQSQGYRFKHMYVCFNQSVNEQAGPVNMRNYLTCFCNCAMLAFTLNILNGSLFTIIIGIVGIVVASKMKNTVRNPVVNAISVKNNINTLNVCMVLFILLSIWGAFNYIRIGIILHNHYGSTTSIYFK